MKSKKKGKKKKRKNKDRDNESIERYPNTLDTLIERASITDHE